jgi:chemotaxis protein methyltransferase CheR
MHELELDGFVGYREHLESHADEWSVLDGLCRITISRFWRDRAVFQALIEDVVPTLAESVLDRGDEAIRCWSCGCASGEEPYSIRIGWVATLAEQYPSIALEILATDSDHAMLERARRATYPTGSLKDLPGRLQSSAFEVDGDSRRLRDTFTRGVTWRCQDVREQTPKNVFDLVLCRNLVFTYYDDSLQLEIARRIATAVRPGGALVVGSHERLPPGQTDFEPWSPHGGIHRRRP